jgi:hypothetical protein
VDAYKTGSHTCFEGDEAYIVLCCGMTGFAAMEPIKHATSQTFASAVMKLQLLFGLCHTIILDKDSKFLGALKEACDLLQLKRPILSSGNHNPMMVKRVNRYLNKGLKIITNKPGSVWIAWRPSSSFSTHGIVPPFWVSISPAVLLHLVASSDSLSTSRLTSIGNSLELR